jgi:hypothetical protein
MYSKLIIGFSLFFSWAISAQEITNTEKSNYKFKKIYLHDATPVQSQGNTGTCFLPCLFLNLK